MLRFVLAAVLLAPAGCAQGQEKPLATSDARARRADTVITSPAPIRVDSAVVFFPTDVETERIPLRAGETGVEVLVHTAPGPHRARLAMLNVHDDEDTSVEAALDVLPETGGVLVELVHTGARTLAFRTGGRSATADPNRIFTDAGRRRTLAALSADTPAARAATATFAEALLETYTRHLAPGQTVVTLHNNTDGRYSAASYLPGGDEAVNAAAVTVHPGVDPDDFFFVTDRGLYDALVARGFNAVLQDNDRATDDGSLSVWAARAGVPYVNVEAEHGHRAEQARMIRALAEVLAARE